MDVHWDECTCAYAAEGGHLEVLKWARENGCPWDEYTCELQKVDIQKYLNGQREWMSINKHVYHYYM